MNGRSKLKKKRKPEKMLGNTWDNQRNCCKILDPNKEIGRKELGNKE